MSANATPANLSESEFSDLYAINRVLSFEHVEAVQRYPSSGPWDIYEYSSFDGEYVCVEAGVDDDEIADRCDAHDHAHSMRTAVRVRPVEHRSMPHGYDAREMGISQPW